MPYSYIRDLRNETLWRLYQELRATGEFKTVKAIADHIAGLEMPMHFISYCQARRFYNDYFYRKRKRRHTMHPLNQKIYESFLNLCICLRRTDHKISEDRKVISKALLSPSPCIGLDGDRIYRILRSMGAH